MKNKKKIIIALILIVLIIIGIVIIKIQIPKIQLNKAISYLKNGDYKEAYLYINETNNEENKVIIEELISEIFCNRTSLGLKKVDEILQQSTKIIRKVNINNMDYTLDDSLNLEVEALEKYIDLENDISSNMISEELRECYSSYFNILKYVKENFINIIEHINDTDFINHISTFATEMQKDANDFFSYADNHKFKAKTQDIYQEIQKYIIK